MNVPKCFCINCIMDFDYVNTSTGTVPSLVDVSFILPFGLGLDILYGMRVQHYIRFDVSNAHHLKRENMAHGGSIAEHADIRGGR